MKFNLLAACLVHITLAVPSNQEKRDSIKPVVKGTPQVVGILADSSLNRDSCGSSLFGDRALWVCRDTQHYDPDGIPNLPIFTSSASWSDFVTGGGSQLTMYGDNQDKSFYPLVPGNCDDNQAGICSDGTRYPLWANAPPLVTSLDSSGTTTGYTWISNSHISGLSDLIQHPSVALYRVTYTSGASGLPKAELVNQAFWAENDIPFGTYGGVVQDDIVYIWGQATGGLCESRTCTQLDDDAATIENASAGGQGTYYFSNPWKSFVWIGQPSNSVSADFYITTSPAPEGPWTEPVKFYSGANGNYSLGAYTLQANPAFSLPDSNEIYLTYTKTDAVGDNVALYTTPLILVEWEN
ncbi:hypothetical protein N7481_001000 [Penicillium waksmanii]|uniref:uncharacterized protein n=1 Tax=Penicillium waksmanii TaxID=69791 RepID=UPI0025480A23|nr:uncharacterized protein N7481_001000 [Penicillium waksmanii]KAJ6000591.1 hypothetical protein N7481_001000 [Penicillium waksmanii]